MLLIRNVFQGKPGQAKTLVNMFKDTMARARDVHQLYTALFAHSRPACDQNLLHLVIVDLIFVKLLEAVGVHASGVEGAHISLANSVAACYQKKQPCSQRPHGCNSPRINECCMTYRFHEFILVLCEAAGAVLCPENQRRLA